MRSLLFLILIAVPSVQATLPPDPEGTYQRSVEMPEPILTAKEAIVAVKQRIKAPKDGESFKDYQIASASFTSWNEAHRWTLAGAFPITPAKGEDTPKNGRLWFWFVVLRNTTDAKDGVFFTVDTKGRGFRGPEKLYNHEIQKSKHVVGGNVGQPPSFASSCKSCATVPLHLMFEEPIP